MSSLVISVAGQSLLHGPLDLAAEGAARVREVLSGSDAAITNLEATVAVEGAWPTKTKTLHLTSPEGIASLRDLGFGVLTHANNHAFDLGPPGLARTRGVVEGLALQLVGSGVDRDDAARTASVRTASGRIAVLSVDLGPQPDIVYAGEGRAGINGLRVRRRVTVPASEHGLLRNIVEALGDDRRAAARAAVGYSAGSTARTGTVDVFGTEVVPGEGIASRFVPDPDDFERFVAALGDAARDAALTVVAIHNHHWDADWTRTPDWLTDLARGLIDRGADLVVGTGAPVLQGLSFFKGKPILAGLGNLIFHTARSERYDREGVDVWTGAICRCRFDLKEQACTTVEILPVAAGRPATAAGEPAPAPVPLARDAAERVYERLTEGLGPEDRGRVVLLDAEAR